MGYDPVYCQVGIQQQFRHLVIFFFLKGWQILENVLNCALKIDGRQIKINLNFCHAWNNCVSFHIRRHNWFLLNA